MEASPNGERRRYKDGGNLVLLGGELEVGRVLVVGQPGHGDLAPEIGGKERVGFGDLCGEMSERVGKGKARRGLRRQR